MGEYEKNRGKWESMENLGEYGWWENWGVFVSLRSWVKYGENIEGVGNMGEEWGSVVLKMGKKIIIHFFYFSPSKSVPLAIKTLLAKY